MRLLKINSLPGSKEWVDRDVIMFHACFQILQDCVEKEGVLTHYNYETHKKFVDEATFLYNWWIKEGNNLWDFSEYEEYLLRLIKIKNALWT